MKSCLFLFFAFASIMGSAFSQSLAYKTLLETTYDKEFPLIYPSQLDTMEKALFLDTRALEEFEVSHIQGAQWVGYELFDMASVQDYDKGKPIVVYCSIGARSQEIGQKLAEEGFEKVYNLYGGMFHWVNEGHPVYRDGNLPTNQVHAYNRMWGIWLNKGEKVY